MYNTPLGNRDLIRAINRSIILNTIKTHGVIGRADVARLTGLSPATVTGITADLIEEGLVFEKEPGDSSGGRRQMLLAINPQGGYVVGIKVMEDHALGALTDLEAGVLEKLSQPLIASSPEALQDALYHLVQKLLEHAGIPASRLMGIGIGMAGIIDAERGILRQSPFFGWRNVPLRDMLQARFNLPVYIDNDVNTLTFAEKWFGAGQGINHFLVFTVGRGIGLGLVANGQFFRGVRGGAGEFGHMVVDPQGPACDCGKKGCLEAYIGDKALLSQAAAAFEAGELPRKPENIDELLVMLQAGQPAAQEIFSRAGELFGRGVASLINLFDPELILISGEGTQRGEWFFKAMEESVQCHTMPGLLEDVKIKIEPWGDDAWARGAASLVLHELFEPPVKQ
jgi:predicted NBD/HSP70 family sugar kinase